VENRDLGWSRPASGENWVPMKMNEFGIVFENCIGGPVCCTQRCGTQRPGESCGAEREHAHGMSDARLLAYL
jgi:hypothetical protein